MIFGSFPVDAAQGVILAHSLRLRDRTLKKGRLLADADLAALKAAGVSEVVGARLGEDDVAEDVAAARIAAAVAGPGSVCTAAFTGRCNIVATRRGLAVLDRERLERLNAVDEAVTIATIAPGEVVEERQILATVKIIPFATSRAVVDASLTAAGNAPPLRVAPFRARRAALILTSLPGTKASVLDHTVEVIRGRMDAMAGTLAVELRCDHDERAIADAVSEALGAGCDLVLISGASATVDRRDVVPAGILRAGGTIEHFGMPVDPGNLLLLARHGDVPVVDLPGCGRSPKLNGLDWVLRRIAADQDVGRAAIMAMGVGGLLKDIPAPGRPLPRDRAVRGATAPSAPVAPRVAAVVLAAGRSTRMGSNKLLAPFGDAPLLCRMLDAVLASQARPVVVVTGHEAEAVRAAIGERPVTIAHNPDYASGMASSLKAGLAAVDDPVDGAIVCLGDMPLVGAAHINRLIAAFNPTEGRTICLPVREGRRGNPVLIGRRFFPLLMTLTGDVGARQVVADNGDSVCEVEFVGDEAIFADVDTPDALRRAEAIQYQAIQ